MPFIPVPNAVRSSLLYLWDNQVIVNTLTFYKATQPTVAEMASLNTALHTWYTNFLKANYSNGISLTGISTIGLWSANAPGSLLIVTPEPGSVVSAPTSNNVAWVTSLRTALRGRNYRGRYYHPAIPINNLLTNNVIGQTAATAIVTAMSQLLTPANVASFIWAVASKFLNKVPRGTGILTDIAAVTGDLVLDSQRRRLPLRGA